MGTILVFDSGVGGLTVLRAIQALLPDVHYVYVADDAAFPYGAWDEDALSGHIVALFDGLISAHKPDLAVIACNTASTLVLPSLRARFDIPFVGTVPAIKPAAERTKSGLISVLATPGTVRRDYTRALIRDFAGQCEVTLVASKELAAMAEAKLAGKTVEPVAIGQEIAAAFVEKGGRRTDQIVLACTHYPWLLEEFQAAAPWAVDYIDPAPAIAKHVVRLLPAAARDGAGANRIIFTGGRKIATSLCATLQPLGLIGT